MSRTVVTDIGAENLANALTGKRKFITLGFQVAEGDGNTSDEVAIMLAATDLNGIKHPNVGDGFVGEYYPLLEELPVQGTTVTDTTNWFINYLFQIRPEDIVTPFTIQEIGLWAQQLAVPTLWDFEDDYVSQIDYVSDGATGVVLYFKPIQDSPPDWDIGTPYLIGDVVKNGGTAFECIQDNTGEEPPDVAFWTAIVIAPGVDGGAYWLEVFPTTVNNQSLIEIGDPYLYYYIVRNDFPLPVVKEHALIWNVRIGMTQQQAQFQEITFSDQDVVSYTETQLSFIEALTDEMNSNRALAEEVEALRLAIENP